MEEQDNLQDKPDVQKVSSSKVPANGDERPWTFSLTPPTMPASRPQSSSAVGDSKAEPSASADATPAPASGEREESPVDPPKSAKPDQ